jgi:hypothetical protein
MFTRGIKGDVEKDARLTVSLRSSLDARGGVTFRVGARPLLGQCSVRLFGSTDPSELDNLALDPFFSVTMDKETVLLRGVVPTRPSRALFVRATVNCPASAEESKSGVVAFDGSRMQGRREGTKRWLTRLAAALEDRPEVPGYARNYTPPEAVSSNLPIDGVVPHHH